MDIDKILKNVSTLNEYIVVTQDINTKLRNSKIQFNMSTVLSLKKVRALEIEYFNKCEGSGAAIIIFQRMIELPPSKTWILLGKELVALLQYWLDAMRKHLIKHSVNWWNFTNLLLGFIKSIRVKDKSLPDILVEGTAECLLDLATSTVPDVTQRLEILYCLNLCCAESSREIRFALKNKLDDYFTKLSRLLSSCGHLPSQYSILEALLRWLLPRHDTAVRKAAAAKWFPEGGNTTRIFMDRPWQNFLQDARDLLNSYNEASDLVVSVLIRKLTIGTVVVISGFEKRETWLDVNSSERSVSILLDAKVLDILGLAPVSWETLLLRYDDIVDIQLTRETKGVTLLVHTYQLARVFSSGVEVGDSCELKAVVATSHIERLDRALRKVFDNKYKVLFDVGKLSLSSPPQNNPEKKHVSQDEDTRFSHPVEVQRRKRSGYIVRSRNPIPWRSPSTASTTSLAQLHEKLASLPQYKFEKEAVHVCALPELSTVTEVSEFDDRQSLISNSTLKLNRPYGVCHKSLINTDRNSQSDGEVHKRPKVGRYLSPVAKDDEHSTSCLLVATVGSADESVINDTLERLNKTKDFPGDSIVDLLVQEALQRDFHDKDGLLDSGINTGDKKSQDPNEANSEAIENTPNVDKDIKQNKQDHEKTCTVISNTTTDESNDVVDDTPLNFVCVRRRKQQLKEKTIAIEEERLEFDVQAVDNFFSQHITENNRGDIVISPTLARKINETSSESENFDECLMRENNNINIEETDQREIQEISDWLDSMVEKVCNDLEKYTEIIRNEERQKEIIEPENNVIELAKSDGILCDVSNIENIRVNHKETDTATIKTTKNKAIKLKYNTKKVTRSRAKGKNNKSKLELETRSNMTPIAEVKEIEEVEITRPVTPEPKKDSPTNKSDTNGTPLLRRKRKLYSPKDENVDEERKNAQIIETEEDTEFKTSRFQTPKSTATCYKEIEKERKKNIRQPRKRRSKTKSECTASPRTKKMNDIFDHLKDKVESNESITVAGKRSFDKDLAIFNFTSDSEDEDFKKKKIEIQKRMSSTTVASGDSSMSARHRRAINRVNYSETKSSDESNKKKPKKVVRRKRQAKKRLVKANKDLVDERMRNAEPVDLNTSLVVEKTDKNAPQDPAPVIAEPHRMEGIADESVIKITELDEPKKRQRRKKTDALSLKKEKANNMNTLEIEIVNDDRTESPLPGLVVETIPTNVDDVNDSVSANMLQKFKKYYQEGPENYINESNTTQNLLSDLDKITRSPPPMNITDELNKIDAYEPDVNDLIYNNTSRITRSKKKDNVIELVDEGEKVDKSKIIKVKKEISSKIKRKHVENIIEVVNISEVSDMKSEKSIATIGKSPITAHGDNDEQPPNYEMLSQKLQPRDLEIEDLNQSIKDYYKKLNKELINADNKCTSSESDKTRLVQNVSRASSDEKSIVVSVSRLSIDDISKWLPSRRNSDTDSSFSVDKAKPNSQVQNDNLKSKLEDTEQSSSKSKHVLSKTRPSVPNLDDIILEFRDNKNENTKSRKSGRFVLQYPQNIDSRTKSIHTTCESPVEIVETNKQKRKSRTKVKKTRESSSEDVQQLENTKRLRSYKKNEDQNQSVDRNNTLQPLMFNIENTPKSQETKTRKSLISPIKLFDGMIPTTRMVRRHSSSDEESAISNIQDIQSNTKVEIEKSLKNKNNHKENTDTSPESKISASTRIVEPPKSKKRKFDTFVKDKVKRVRISPEVEIVEKRIERPAVTISDSGPSESSVNEWFRRNVPISRAESVNASFKESIQSVMEKLDTTLAEIHQNTSKKFVHMFVDAQKNLTDLKQERRKMFRSVASDILAEVVKVVDCKFAELDQKSQEMDVEFMNQLKVQASELIRDDCKKKQVMITLLREDIQAVMDHMESQRRSESL